MNPKVTLSTEDQTATDASHQHYADTHGDDDPPAWARPRWAHRVPPSNDKAEIALLSALMVNNLAFGRMGHFLRAEHFADPIHGAIFERIQQRIEAGQMADVVTLTATFEHTGQLDEVGGTAYLRQLLTAEAAIIDVHAYAQSIADAWLRRQTIEIAEQIVIVATSAHRHALGDTRRQSPLSGPDLAGGLIARVQESLARLQSHVDDISEVVL